ncbi:MAG: glycoside hydrolase family 30 beta sandwich domain-containing protein [Terracidiphilus sp.]|jgi:glucosylceramidase
MKTRTRRVFLQHAATFAAGLACTRDFPAFSMAAPPSSKLRAWITSGDQRFDELDVEPWQPTAGHSSSAVEVETSKRFQSILGFGGAFTDSSCYLLSCMGPAQRQALMDDFFGSNGLHLSVGRTCMGASDYSRTAYTFDDSTTPDPELSNFSIEHDRAYILPTLRDALRINPEMFYFSAPWTPPAWMKTGDSLLGGSMRKKYFASYAQYFVKFIEAYKAESIHVSAVTCQNEPDTDQDGRMPASLWGQEYEAGFIKEFLGPALRDASLDTKIWLLDHNYNLWGRAVDQLNDPDVFKFVDGVAWHGYFGTPDAMTTVHDAFPTKGTYWTEGGPDFTAPDYTTDWATWSGTFTGVLKNWARCIVAWNFILDEKGNPNIGPFNCGGVVTLDSKTQQLTRSGQYWAFAHYSKAVRRGARVLATHANLPGIEHVAFANPDGDFVLVLTNEGEAREIDCTFEGKSLHLSLPKNSIVTLQWS